MRLNVIWCGEMPYFMEEIERLLGRRGLFSSIGTSGNVYPAAGFARMIRLETRTNTAELNLEPSKGVTFFEEAVYGPATEIVPAHASLPKGLPDS